MKRFLTAIALMVSLASPSGALMAQAKPVDDEFVMVSVVIYASEYGANRTYVAYKDGTCDGVGKFANYRMGATAELIDNRGNPFVSAKIGRSQVSESHSFCFLNVAFPKPPIPFSVVIDGQLIYLDQIQNRVINKTQVMTIHLRE